jgi:apolipoprotein N-acyltransferase
MLGAAGIWVATEYFRGSFPWNGLPWLYLGHTQSPFLSMIQLADATGVAGISFWVACINIAVAMLLMQRLNIARCTWMFVTLGVMLLAILSYGWFRIGETPNKLSPGIKVMVVQSNYPQSNSGDKGAAPNEIVDFHLNTTRKALTESGGGVDLVAWSETMMPPLNKSARLRARNFQSGEFWLDTHRAIQNLGNDFSTALIVGGTALDDWDKDLNFHKRFNSAFYYDTGGTSWDERYDKIHLVPFGEFIPFKEDFPPLYQLLMYFNPYGYDYTVSFGDSEKLTVFKTRDVRFVTPICFEDIDAWLVAQMFRSDNGKRADLIVNLTNDGWFCFNQMPQHLQAAIFRSIENRVPTARSVNTGISGFIDSVGRTHDTLASGVAGVSSSEVKIDSRYTLFTRHGEWFALTCVVWTSLLATSAVLRWALVRLAGKRND